MKKIFFSLFSATTMLAIAQKDISVELLNPGDNYAFNTTDTAEFLYQVTNTGTLPLTSEDMVFFRMSIGNFFWSVYDGHTADALLPIPRPDDSTNVQSVLMPGSSFTSGFKLDYLFSQINVDSMSNHEACINALVWNDSTNWWYTDSDLTDNWGCNTGIQSVGTKELVENAFSVYPNPVINKLYINSKEDHTLVTIYNIEGKSIKSSLIVNGENEIDVSSFNNGIYYYIIKQNGSNIETGKFVK